MGTPSTGTTPVRPEHVDGPLFNWPRAMSFWTYMLHCRGGVFYVGHTDNLERMLAEHRSGQFAGFTQGRHPLSLVWSQEFPTRYEALVVERQIKGWSRRKKLALIRSGWGAMSALAKSRNGPSTSSGRTEVRVASDVIARLLDEAARTAPRECCGLLMGEGLRIDAVVPAANVHPDPLTRFEIDPAALLAAHRAAREGGPRIAGYYHSHPAGHPRPSATDCEHASGDGRIWAIAAGGAVTFWRDGLAGFEELPTRLVDG